MHGDLDIFLGKIGSFLGWYYLLLAAMKHCVLTLERN